jgi:uncharacterized protein
MNIAAKKHWYKEPWPWLLMIMPLVSVIAGSITAWLAVTTADGLVTDDYYKEGLAINKELARDDKARALELSATLSMAKTNVEVVLQGKIQTAMPDTLLLSFAHPTRSGQDQKIRLQSRGNGHYIAQVSKLKPGKWHLILEDPEGGWRLASKVNLPLPKAYVMEANK